MTLALSTIASLAVLYVAVAGLADLGLEYGSRVVAALQNAP